MPDIDLNTRTRTLARIIGPLLIAAAAAIFTRYETLDLLFPAFFSDGMLVLITGVFTLIVGLTVFTLHHHWTSPPAIAITLLGILTCVRGAALMIAPDIAAMIASSVPGAPIIALIGSVFVLLLGAWLTFVGWFAKSN